jgi:hypothetical protein
MDAGRVDFGSGVTHRASSTCVHPPGNDERVHYCRAFGPMNRPTPPVVREIRLAHAPVIAFLCRPRQAAARGQAGFPTFVDVLLPARHRVGRTVSVAHLPCVGATRRVQLQDARTNRVNYWCLRRRIHRRPIEARQRCWLVHSVMATGAHPLDGVISSRNGRRSDPSSSCRLEKSLTFVGKI